MAGWQARLWVLVAIGFLMFAAFGFVNPFMPLFIGQLGVGDLHQVEIWSGITQFSQAMVLAFFSPIWGAVADRRGRRLMVLRAAFGGGVVMGAMGLSQNIWHFFFLRLLQGVVTGVIAAVTALATSFVPRERIGYALGLIQMSAFAGNAVGPLLGGFVADRAGYRPSFAVTGGLFLLAGVLTLLFVKEDFQRPATEAGSSSGLAGLLGDIRTRGADRQLLVMLLVLFSAQFGVSAVQPTLPLFVQVLQPNESVAATTGVIFTVAGVVAAVASVIWGRVGDRIGFRRLLLMMAIGAGLIYIPEGLVQTAGQLIVLRGILGIFDGGLLPSVSALIGQRSMQSQEGQASQGTTFGFVNLANAIGFALGPLSGGLIAASLGLRAQFFITAGILLAIAALLPFVLRDPIGPSRRATVLA
ncbi:MAG: MFS transporter [Chloroflexi bacterium]|nr:MFS transporter [Chloroflexota bacterium]